MGLKFLNASGNGNIDNGAAAIVYATDKGAKVTSNSWGCNCNSQVLEDALQYAHDRGVTNIAAAGNSSADALGYSPANSDNVITVGSTGTTDIKSSFSNFGPKLDVMAPGEDILSLRSSSGGACSQPVGNIYCRMSGTSMATPHVAGLAVLVLSKNPELSNEQIRQLLRTQTTDLGSAGFDTNYGYGRIDAYKAIANTNTAIPDVYINSPVSRTDLSSQATIDVRGVASGSDFASYKVEIGAGDSPTSWQVIQSSVTPVTSLGSLATFNPGNYADGTYTIRLTVTNNDGKAYDFKIYGLVIDYVDVSIVSPSAAIAKSTVDITGTIVTKNGKTLDNYKIEYGLGAAPTSYQTAGVVLENGGAQSVANGMLGKIDGSLLADKQKYQLRISVTTTDGYTSTVTTPLVADHSLVDGWPKNNTAWPCVNASYTCEVSPVAVNIDADAELEIVVGDHPRNLTAYNRDGTVVPGWPFTPVSSKEFFRQPVVHADLDGDGKQEIIAVSSISGASGGNLYVLKNDGTVYPGWTTKFLSASYLDGQVEDLTPSIADLNGDGALEIIAWESRANIYLPLLLHAFNLAGGELSGFPASVVRPSVPSSNKNSSPVVEDINKDGKFEIITHFSNYVYVFDNNGIVMPGWPQSIAAETGGFTGQVVADLEGTGMLKVIARGTTNAGTKLYAWDINGVPLANWPQTSPTGPYTTATPKVAMPVLDTNGDGKEEVAMNTASHITLHGLTGMATIATSTTFTSGSAPVPAQFSPGGAPVFARDECPNYYINQRFYNLSGTTRWSSANHAGGLVDYEGCFGNTSLVGDINGNGNLEMVSTRSSDRATAGNYLFMWEIPGSQTSESDSWMSPFHDARHTQRFNSAYSGDAVAPIVSLAKPLPGSSYVGGSKVRIEATATDNQGVSRVDFLIDGAVVCQSFTEPYGCDWQSQSVSTDTNKTVQAKAFDAALNSASSQDVTIQLTQALDTIKPVVSLTKPLAASSYVGGSTVQLEASATDNRSVSRVDFLVDGAVVCQSFAVPYGCNWLSPTVSANTNKTIQARAYDAASNSAISQSVSIQLTLPPDTAAPTVSLTKPLAASSYAGGSLVRIEATATDNRTVQRVDFLLDGVVVCQSFAAPYGCNWQSPLVAFNTNKTVQAKAYDGASNSASSIVVTIQLTPMGDTLKPVISITSPSSGASFKRKAVVTINASGSDNIAVSKVEFYVNNVLVCTDTIAPYTCTWTAPNTTGAFTLQSRAYDAAGNIGISSNVTINVNR